jgi:hypothetical protein
MLVMELMASFFPGADSGMLALKRNGPVLESLVPIPFSVSGV